MLPTQYFGIYIAQQKIFYIDHCHQLMSSFLPMAVNKANISRYIGASLVYSYTHSRNYSLKVAPTVSHSVTLTQTHLKQ